MATKKTSLTNDKISCEEFFKSDWFDIKCRNCGKIVGRLFSDEPIEADNDKRIISAISNTSAKEYFVFYCSRCAGLK